MEKNQRGRGRSFSQTKKRAAFLTAGVLFMTLFFSSSTPGLAAEKTWLKGYQKTIAGETIGYHSPYPDATSALLVRATDGTMFVEWETEPVPADFKEPFATFIWMAGLRDIDRPSREYFAKLHGKPAGAAGHRGDARNGKFRIFVVFIKIEKS
jgi:hypothetical protein